MKEGGRRLRVQGNVTPDRRGTGRSCAVRTEEGSESPRKQQLQKQALSGGLREERPGPANTAISAHGHPAWASVLRTGGHKSCVVLSPQLMALCSGNNSKRTQAGNGSLRKSLLSVPSGLAARESHLSPQKPRLLDPCGSAALCNEPFIS